jgi:hypothetical protein
VFICSDEAIHADSAAEILYAGLVIERRPTEEIRKGHFGCEHRKGEQRRDGRSLWRCESVVIVAAADEDEALSAARDARFEHDPDERAVHVSAETLGKSIEILVAGEDEDDPDPTTVGQWLQADRP